MMFTRCWLVLVQFENALLLALIPETGRRGGGDGDAALAFLLHPVGHRVAFMHLADLVDHAGVEKDALGQRCLARIDVRGDADVARTLQRVSTIGRIRVSRHNTRLLLSRIEVDISLPPEVCKGAVGLRHFVRVVTLLDRVALAGGRILDLGRQTGRHRALARFLAKFTIHRIASATWRSWGTSIGTW